MLLKSIVQAIPTFAMSCFKLPIGLCHNIEMMIWKFWWGQRGDRQKIHWKKWETLCKPKAIGGLGFRDLCKFNDVMLAKQDWRLANDTKSFSHNVFKARYFPNGTIFDVKASSGSYAWESILWARKVISMGARWRVGDGNQIRIFEDRWMPFEGSGKIISPCLNLHRDAVVSTLIDNDMAA